MFTLRRFFVFLLDLFLILESYGLAILLDQDFNFTQFTPPFLLKAFSIIFVVQALVFLTSNMYRNLWQYASLHDMIEIFKTVAIACILSGLALFLFRQGAYFSRVVFILNWGLLLTQVVASRLCWRVYRERTNFAGAQPSKKNSNSRRTLIVGAGDAGNMLLREILKQPANPYTLIGFIDDDPEKQKMCQMGIEVLGTTAEMDCVITAFAIELVIIAVPSVGFRFVREIVTQCQKSGVCYKIIPGLSEIIRGDVKISQIRDVEIDDLLGRSPVVLNEQAIGSYLEGMRVLVSGAAGSIGSEICRQVARYSPALLVLLDNAETPLYQIERELAASFPALRIVPLLGDVRNRQRLEQIFASVLPEVVFHAAAYKHVPLVEYNPAEAVLCNVMGSMNMANTARHAGVRNFVLISTDKAVNPTNVMGATKRIAEKFIQSLAVDRTTKFSTVRFGNVLGSNGSVIPLFTEQIRKGGPLTITHPEVTRFFMTIPEASQLVLQSVCFGSGGEIFVLDMGEPVRIVDLAEELVRLSGMIPYTDIEFTFTGLRPGEKLYEELFFRGENILKTPNEKIHVLADAGQDHELLCQQLEKLLSAVNANNIELLMSLLSEIVPEYTPTTSS